ncbi:MAG: phytoene desaturase family protein [Actinomycetota bacterium]
MARYDAVVVGGGPNGLAAAVHLARSGASVLVLEREETVGGGSRSAQLTVPGFVHDVCSAVHPFAAASPFFQELPLHEHGLELIQPPAPLAHPLDDGSAVILRRSVSETASDLAEDAAAYVRLVTPFVERFDGLAAQVMGPLRPPRHPVLMARFGLHGVRSARALAEGAFGGERARALFAGLAAHSVLALERPLTAAFGMILGAAAHAVGWPVARGGSQRIVDALASLLATLGGEVQTGVDVRSMDDLPSARAYLFDVVPANLDRIAGDRLPATYRDRLRKFRRGPGVFKLDLALDGPLPWMAPDCSEAGTVHLGGTLDEVAGSESLVAAGKHPERPFVLLAQQSVVDDSRAPAGKHAVWAYCHVPNGSTVDMTDAIEGQIERFAPGFRDLVLGRHAMGPADLERYNPNYPGGDISGGASGGLQLFARPVASVVPYAAPARDIFLCSSSTPPGAGVHGMCGFHAAEAAMRRLRSTAG